MDDVIYTDAFDLLCGDKIGEGVDRVVFACRVDPQWVVKVETSTSNRYFANVFECKLWCEYQDHKPVADWLAPCGLMSPDGRALLQRRVDPLPRDYALPDRLPAFLRDIKRENFGIFEDRLVCVDYSRVDLRASKRLRKVEW